MQNLSGVSNGNGYWMQQLLTGERGTCEAEAARITFSIKGEQHSQIHRCRFARSMMTFSLFETIKLWGFS